MARRGRQPTGLEVPGGVSYRVRVFERRVANAPQVADPPQMAGVFVGSGQDLEIWAELGLATEVAGLGRGC